MDLYLMLEVVRSLFPAEVEGLIDGNDLLVVDHASALDE
jgi:hypothetical protein